MGEASIPRRPTDDTHIIIIINNNNNTSSKQIQIQTHHEDYWIDCIYHDASCYYCGSRVLCELFPKSACPYRPKMLLRLHLECEACKAGVTERKSASNLLQSTLGLVIVLTTLF